jgi:hypothetical protein
MARSGSVNRSGSFAPIWSAELGPQGRRSAVTAAASVVAGATILRLIEGQSNAVGASGIDSAPLKINYGALSPQFTVAGMTAGSVSSTAGLAYGWYDLLYSRAGDTGLTDRIDGSVSGSRGERVIQNVPYSAVGGVSHLIGVAEQVNTAGYHSGAASIRAFKFATFGKPLVDLDPYLGTGGIYKNGRSAIKKQLRPFVAAEIAAGRTVLAQAVMHVQGEGDVSAAQQDGISFTGSASGNTVTITANTSAADGWTFNTLAIGQTLVGQGVPNGITVTSLGTAGASGAPGTFTVSASLGTIASQNFNTGDLNDPYIAGWAARMTGIIGYYNERFGQALPWILQDIIQVSTTNAGGTLDPYTLAVRANMKGLCRYTVLVAADGSIGATVDQGAGGERLNNSYFLEHAFLTSVIGPMGLHYTVPQQQALGKAVTLLEKRIGGNSVGLTAFPITRIAPVVTAFSLGAATGTTQAFSITVDEACTIFALALPSASAAPSQAAVLAGGQQFTYSENATTQDTSSANFTLTGLTAATSYKVYTVCRTPDASADTGSVVNQGTFTTDAAGGTSYDTAFNNNANVVYSNGNKTVSRLDASGGRATRSVTSKSSGKFYVEYLVSGANALTIGIAESTAGTGNSGGTRYGWISANVVTTAGNTNMGGSLVATDVVQMCLDFTAQLIWMRRNNTGNWNNTAGANPATATGGLSISALGTAFIYTAMGANTASSITIRTSTAEWGFAAPSGFGQWT